MKAKTKTMLAEGCVIALILAAFGLLVATWIDNIGRARVAECGNRRILVSPGTWSDDWCIQEYRTGGYSDEYGYHDTSGYVAVRCYSSETSARSACTTGQY